MDLSEFVGDPGCQHCGTPVGWLGNGRPRRFCSGACRARAYRRRLVDLPEQLPVMPRGHGRRRLGQ